MRYSVALSVLIALAACGAPANNNTPQRGTSGITSAPPTAAAVYCQRSGGQLIERVSGGRRADLCKLPTGRTVRAADLLNSHNSL